MRCLLTLSLSKENGHQRGDRDQPCVLVLKVVINIREKRKHVKVNYLHCVLEINIVYFFVILHSITIVNLALKMAK